MTVVVLRKYKGWTLKVSKTACVSHPYEHVVSPIENRIVRMIKMPKQSYAVNGLSELRVSSNIKSPYAYRGRSLRLYDVTSMPTARGRYSALCYGKDLIDDINASLLEAPKERLKQKKLWPIRCNKLLQFER
jgi:hypothetical protein